MTEKQSTKALILAAQQGDPVALEQLVEQNNGLIYSVLKRFLNRGQSREDLYQIGCIGLLKAIKRFDFSLNLQFSTYAVSLILGELKQFFRDDGMIKVSREWKALAIRAATVQQEQEKKRGQELTAAQLAKQLGVEPEELLLAMDACKSPDSLDGSCGRTEEVLPAESFPLNELVDRITVRQAISRLEQEEQKLIVLRYFRQKSQKETAEIMGLSQPHVSRTEKKILQKLQKFL